MAPLCKIYCERLRSVSRLPCARFNFIRCQLCGFAAVAASPPSEEGGGTAYKGLKRRDGRRETQKLCESSRYRRTQSRNDTCINLCTPTLSVSSRLAFSLLSRAYKSFVHASFAPLAAHRSCFGYSLSHLRTAVACRLAISATGGARKPNPSEGAEGAPAPCT